MQIVKKSNGSILKITRKEWLELGKTLFKKAQEDKVRIPFSIKNTIDQIVKEVISETTQVNINIEDVSPENVVFIDRSQCAAVLLQQNGKRFGLIYVKSDGSSREFSTQSGVVKYKKAEGADFPRGKSDDLITIYDNNIASRVSSAIKREIQSGRLQGSDLTEDALKEVALRSAYRSINPDRIELIKCGKVWIVEDPTIDKVVAVYEKLKGSPEIQRLPKPQLPQSSTTAEPVELPPDRNKDTQPVSKPPIIPPGQVYRGKDQKKPSWRL